MTLKIKALDPDSEVEVNNLCGLYARSYGSQFKLAPVDAERFWKSRVGNRFTTLIAIDGAKYVASVSLRPDRDNPAHIQLYLAVCDPSYLSAAADIRTAITDLMHRLSIRQKWEMIYSYQFLQIPEQAWFSRFLIDGMDVALWPSSLPSGTKQQKKKAESPVTELGSVLISQRVLSAPRQPENSETLLFAPAKHLKFCRWIYQSLGLPFSVTSDLDEASRQAKSVHDKSSRKDDSSKLMNNINIPDSKILALSADRRAIERQTHRQAGFSICFVEPSLVGSFRELEKVLSRKARCTDYVALNMLDSMTPQFAEQLEQIGFGFGGVLPYHRNRHTLLYYKTVEDFDWHSIKQDFSLIRYLKTNDSQTLSGAHDNHQSMLNAATSRSI